MSNKSLNFIRINKKRHNLYFFKDFLVIVLFLILALLEIIFLLKLFNNNFLGVLILVGINIIFLAIIYIFNKLIYLILNRKFINYYQRILFDECKLNDVYLYEKKDNFDPTYYRNYFEIINLVNYVRIYAIADASKDFTIEITQLENKDEKSKKYGVLFTVDVSKEFNNFLQIRNFSKPTINYYNNHIISKISVNDKKSLKSFDIYSTYGKEIYKNLPNNLIDSFAEFSQFCKSGIVLTVNNNHLSIFIDGWKMNLVRKLKEKKIVIDQQIDVIKVLHDYLINFINCVYSLNS